MFKLANDTQKCIFATWKTKGLLTESAKHNNKNNNNNNNNNNNEKKAFLRTAFRG